MERVLAYPQEGGALTGVSEIGFPEPPRPEDFMLLGDFNMLTGSEEYVQLVGRVDHEFGMPLVASRPVDAAALVREGEPGITCVDIMDPADESRWKRIDYCFVSAGLAGKVKASWVDAKAVGSDHLPVWVELS
jgi:endonuclease/exonuclease/phosphatase family metal-dependent hydrolase